MERGEGKGESESGRGWESDDAQGVVLPLWGRREGKKAILMHAMLGKMIMERVWGPNVWAGDEEGGGGGK